MNMMQNLSQLVQDQDIAFSFWSQSAGGDTLVVTAFAVEEALFGLSRIEVMLSSYNPAIDLQALMDTPATLTVHHKSLPIPRHFSGIVVEAERGDEGHHRTAYRVTLLPTLYRLDNNSDCRIFQEKTVPDIIRTVFNDYEIHDVEWDLSADYRKREYCVMYRESYLAFVERIMAEEGIFYFFTHDKEGKHKLIISDAPYNVPDCPSQDKLEYNAMASGAVKGVYCSSLNYREKLRATRFVQRDYSFKNPKATLNHVEAPRSAAGEKQQYQLYDYPGRYKTSDNGAKYTRNKMEAVRVDSSIAHGVANAPLLLSGHKFILQEHPVAKLNQRWRLLTIRHEGVQPQALGEDAQGASQSDARFSAPALGGTELAGLSFGIARSKSPGLLDIMMQRGLHLAANKGENGQGDAAVYACAFTANAFEVPYRPPQSQKPLVDGPQIAHVVGPPGEEIYTDEHGRVKVHFPWDRHSEVDAEDSSCWIRVATTWAGGTWGSISIPRIGHEVIVDFLEGDPDQPIITGRTYHATNKTPYQLPDHKTKMVIRSDTHKGEGFNELSFEDEADGELVYIHAQKDESIRVNNDKTESIGHNETRFVGNDYEESIGNNKKIFVNHVEEVNIGKSRVVQIGETQNERIGKDMIFETGNILKETIGASRLIEIGRHQKEHVQGVYELTAGEKMICKTVILNIDASTNLQIRGPGGKIIIDSSSITLESPNIRLNGNVSVSGGSTEKFDGIKSAIKNELPLAADCPELEKSEDKTS